MSSDFEIADANVTVSGAYNIDSRFKACGKSNLTLHIFEDHDLNFQEWPGRKNS